MSDAVIASNTSIKINGGGFFVVNGAQVSKTTVAGEYIEAYISKKSTAFSITIGSAVFSIPPVQTSQTPNTVRGDFVKILLPESTTTVFPAASLIDPYSVVFVSFRNSP